MPVIELQQFKCPSCHKVINSKFSAFTTSIKCEYCQNLCHNPLISEKEIPVPERLVSFTTEISDFESRLAQNLVNEDYVPENIFDSIKSDNVQKMYLPMFVYEGTYNASWNCEASYIAKEVRSGSSDMTTKWQPMNGTSKGRFSIMCLAYEGDDIPEEMKNFASSLLYNAGNSWEYNPDLLGLDSDDPPYLLESNSDAERVWGKYGDQGVKEMAQKAAKEQLNGQEIRNFKVATNYELNGKGRYVLAPFWFVYYYYNKQKHYFIMDGQGEDAACSYPVSPDDVDFVNKINKLDNIMSWMWVAAIVVFYFFTLKAGLIVLALWFGLKFAFKKYYVDPQIQQRFEESRQKRLESAQKHKFL